MFLLPEMNVIFPFAKKIYSGLFFTKIDKVKKGLTFFWKNGSKTKTKQNDIKQNFVINTWEHVI